MFLEIKDVYMNYKEAFKIINKVPLLALFAVVISSVTAYYQFFWSEQSLQIGLLNLSIKYEQNTVKLKTAFVNGGTEPILVSGYRLGVIPKTHDGLVYLSNLAERPFIIKPGDILINEDSVQISSLQATKLTNVSCESHEIAINIETLTNEGDSFFKVAHIASVVNDNGMSMLRTNKDLIDLLNNEKSLINFNHLVVGTRESFIAKVNKEQIKGCELYS
jgi:hypothetical protein